MDLLALFRHVPHLLDACVCDHIPALRSLRLISKEAGQAVMPALKSYSLTFSGPAWHSNSLITQHTDLRGVKVLQGARLQNLDVLLCLSGTASGSV